MKRGKLRLTVIGIFVLGLVIGCKKGRTDANESGIPQRPTEFALLKILDERIVETEKATTPLITYKNIVSN